MDLVFRYKSSQNRLDSYKDFVEEIEAKAMARDFFTFQFAQDAIRNMFPEEAEELIEGLVQLLFFDAIVGNNDRHFYN